MNPLEGVQPKLFVRELSQVEGSFFPSGVGELIDGGTLVGSFGVVQIDK